MRIEGSINLHLKTGAPNEREAHQPAAPAHDRRHDRCATSLRRRTTTISGTSGHLQPFSAVRRIRPRLRIFAFSSCIRRRPACVRRAINGSVAALRFFFTVTLDRPEMARHLTFVRETCRCRSLLGRNSPSAIIGAWPHDGLKEPLAACHVGEPAVIRRGVRTPIGIISR